MPIIEIYTQNGAVIADKENYVNMTFKLTDANNPENNVSKTNFKDGIRGRGNTTWLYYPKKPYRIKFDKKTALFGLPAAKSWALLAEYQDPTLLMNATAFKLGDIFNIPYNHSFIYVELYLNGEYKGIYGLTEHNQVGEGRVDIDEDAGWFVELDSYYDEEPKFRTTNYDLPVMIKSPEVEPLLINNPAYDFVRQDLNELCDAMASAGFPENGYRNLIDMNTFVDFLMINEIVGNGELLYPKSTYSYKEKNKKISMGPLWDFSFAYTDVFSGFEVPYFSSYSFRLSRAWHRFFNRFFEDPIFLVTYKERWNEKYDEIVAVSEFIDNTGTALNGSVVQNFSLWNPSNNYMQQITDMKHWWSNRCAWLHTELNKVEALPGSQSFGNHKCGVAIDPQVVTLVAYGKVSRLSATFKEGVSSGFEVVATETEAAGNGGHLIKVSVKPKRRLPASATAYTDKLLLSGTNQGNPFSLEVPLSVVIEDNPTHGTMALTVCDEVTINNETFTASGQYIQYLTNAAGCDSTLTIDLIVKSGNAALRSLVVNEGILMPAFHTDSTHYNIYTSSNITDLIVHAIAADANAKVNIVKKSHVTVITVTAENQVTQRTYTIQPVDDRAEIPIKIYPNPTKDYVNLDLTAFNGKVLVKLYSFSKESQHIEWKSGFNDEVIETLVAFAHN